MKLIDILVQEKFEWTGNIIMIHQDYDGQLWGWYTHGSAKYLKTLKHIADNARKFGVKENMENMVTREQYEAAAEQPVWNGKGLPPVGCECEGKQFAQINWTKFTVVAISNDHVFGFWNDIVAVGLSPKMWEFRPIRSEADKKRDEATSAISEYLNDIDDMDSPVGIASELYDAIAAGKIPGVKLED